MESAPETRAFNGPGNGIRDSFIRVQRDVGFNTADQERTTWPCCGSLPRRGSTDIQYWHLLYSIHSIARGGEACQGFRILAKVGQ